MQIFGKEIYELEEFIEELPELTPHNLEITFQGYSGHNLKWRLTFMPSDELCCFTISTIDQIVVDIAFWVRGNIDMRRTGKEKTLFLTNCVCVANKMYYKTIGDCNYDYTVMLRLSESPMIKVL